MTKGTVRALARLRPVEWRTQYQLQEDRTISQVTVGVPRTLFYYTYFPLWRRFLEELGARVVVSSPSSKAILDAGVQAAVGDACVPIKLMHGHVADLAARGVDFIFLPRLTCTNRRTVYCPKFLGLPDMIASTPEPLPEIIDARYDARRGPGEMRRWALAVGGRLGADPDRILAALRAAQAEQRRYEGRLRLDLDPEVAMGDGQADGPGTGGGEGLRIAVIGYPYLVFDQFVNLDLLARLRELGVRLRFAQSVSQADIDRQRMQMSKDIFWTFSEETAAAGCHFLERPDLVDGVIHLTAFGCGPDSIVNKLLVLRAHEQEARVPLMSLQIDEHTGETGVRTRLEAFIDLARRRRRTARSASGAPAEARGGAPAPALPHPGPVPRRLRRPYARRRRRVTFPYLGTLHPLLADMFRALGHEVVMPNRPSLRTLSLGTAHAPEFACLPFKILLGSYLEALEQGADTIISTGGVGPCRAGMYNELHERILRYLGFQVEVASLEPPRLDLVGFVKRVHDLNPAGLPAWRIAQEVGRLMHKAKALDQLERMSHHTRAREAVRGATTKAYAQSVPAVWAARRRTEVEAAVGHARELLAGVPVRPGYEPLRVGIVGEIYVLVEPSSNFEIEETLGELGIEPDRSIWIGGWAGESNLLGRPGTSSPRAATEAARPYLADMIGGHGQDSVGHAILFAKEGFDGVIQLAPFTCMPEIVSRAVLDRVSREHGIPLLSLLLDELTGKTGLLTRLEAFRDLLERRRRAGGGRRAVGAAVGAAPAP